MRSNIISVFPNFLTTDSLFQKMVQMGAPWDTDIGKSMDVSFFTMYSGLKLPSYFVTLHIINDVPDSQTIAQTLWDVYGKNWIKLWQDFNSQYNPLDNYNVNDTINRNQINNRTVGRNIDYTSSVDGTAEDTSSEDGESKLQHGHVVNDTRNIDNYTYGFNSSIKVPTSAQTQNGTETNSGTDVTTTSNIGEYGSTTTSSREDKTSENTKDNDTTNETISRDRKGNVGNNSYQELLRQEFELWKWNFFYQVFDDVDKFLCLSVFDPCSSVN